MYILYKIVSDFIHTICIFMFHHKNCRFISKKLLYNHFMSRSKLSRHLFRTNGSVYGQAVKSCIGATHEAMRIMLRGCFFETYPIAILGDVPFVSRMHTHNLFLVIVLNEFVYLKLTETDNRKINSVNRL